jgi:hypothetical protein
VASHAWMGIHAFQLASVERRVDSIEEMENLSQARTSPPSCTTHKACLVGSRARPGGSGVCGKPAGGVTIQVNCSSGNFGDCLSVLYR